MLNKTKKNYKFPVTSSMYLYPIDHRQRLITRVAFISIYKEKYLLVLSANMVERTWFVLVV